MLRGIAVLISVSACWAQVAREGRFWVRTLSGSEAVPANVVVGVAVRGDVIATGTAENRVSYDLKLRSAARSEAEARAALNACTVTLQRTGAAATLLMQGRANAAELQLRVPRTARQVTISTAEGAVQLYDLGGMVNAATAGGAMKADRIHGTLEMRSSGGEIWLGSIGGPVRVSTQGGRIAADRIEGDATLETGGGDIAAREVRGLVRATTMGGAVHIQRAGAGVSASTGGGPIEVGEARGPVETTNSGGPVQVGSATGVRCENAAGAIRLNNVSGSLRASTSLGSIIALVMGGRPLAESFLSTGSGDITVVLPSNVGVRIYALTGMAGGSRRIVSEYPGLIIRQQGGQVIAEGDLNGGGPLLRLAGAGGTIFIKRK